MRATAWPRRLNRTSRRSESSLARSFILPYIMVFAALTAVLGGCQRSRAVAKGAVFRGIKGVLAEVFAG